MVVYLSHNVRKHIFEHVRPAKIKISHSSIRDLRTLVVFLLTVPSSSSLFFCFLFVRLWCYIWRSYCPHLFFISPSFGASRELCFLIVAFPGYLQFYFFLLLFVIYLNELFINIYIIVNKDKHSSRLIVENKKNDSWNRLSKIKLSPGDTFKDIQ